MPWRGGGEFWVADDGIGIDPVHIPRLTERFYRVDRGRSRETGGTGLGLAIVKHVTTRHQGELVDRERTGAGQPFRAAFPAGAAHAGLSFLLDHFEAALVEVGAAHQHLEQAHLLAFLAILHFEDAVLLEPRGRQHQRAGGLERRRGRQHEGLVEGLASDRRARSGDEPRPPAAPRAAR